MNKSVLSVKKYNRGFTLIELLVVIAIIGILASVVLASLNSARDKANVAKVKSELNQFRLAIEFLYDDTGQYPNHLGSTPCTDNVEVYLNTPEAGIQSTDGSFPGWNGPYMTRVPLDPWGTNYFFDPDYICGAGIDGCNGSTNIVRALDSFGPDKTQQYTSGDDIVLVLCGA